MFPQVRAGDEILRHRLFASKGAVHQTVAHHGACIAASPESFLVEGLTGALVEGELGQARAWGERLSGVTASEASPGRRWAS
jgi:hypothetical protein